MSTDMAIGNDVAMPAYMVAEWHDVALE